MTTLGSSGGRDPMTVLGKGSYSVPDAARLARVPARRVRAWFGHPTAVRDYPWSGKDGQWLSFLELVEVAVVGVLMAEPPVTTMHAVRAFRARLVGEWGVTRPFAHRRYGDLFRREPEFRVMGELLGQLDYDPATGLACRWRVATGVVIDPRVRFGGPYVEAVGVTTRALAGAARAEGSADQAARRHGVPVEAVWAAVEFEDGLKQRKDAR